MIRQTDNIPLWGRYGETTLSATQTRCKHFANHPPRQHPATNDIKHHSKTHRKNSRRPPRPRKHTPAYTYTLTATTNALDTIQNFCYCHRIKSQRGNHNRDNCLHANS